MGKYKANLHDKQISEYCKSVNDGVLEYGGIYMAQDAWFNVLKLKLKLNNREFLGAKSFHCCADVSQPEFIENVVKPLHNELVKACRA